MEALLDAVVMVGTVSACPDGGKEGIPDPSAFRRRRKSPTSKRNTARQAIRLKSSRRAGMMPPVHPLFTLSKTTEPKGQG